MQHAVWPALLLIVMAIVLLSIWTVKSSDGSGWERLVTDEETGESIGKCALRGGVFYATSMSLILSIPVLLTLVMAWKTRDIDDMYSESKYIFALVLVQIQLLIVGVPTFAILNDAPTNGRYIGMCLLVWSFPMTNVGLIFVPKMYTVYKDRQSSGSPPLAREQSAPRGSNTTVQIPGLNNNNDAPAYTQGTENGNHSGHFAPQTPMSESGSSRMQIVVMQ